MPVKKPNYIELDGVQYLIPAEFARLIKVRQERVMEKIRSGALNCRDLAGKKLIPVEDGKKAWGVSLSLNTSPGAPKKKASGLGNPKIEKLTAEARLKELELRKTAKELVEVADARKHCLKFYAAARSVVDNFADRTHIQLAQMTDPDKVHRFLLDEMDVFLESLRDAATLGIRGEVSSEHDSDSVREKAAANG